ncbi:MAG TPA: DUF6036 family nucleotidyltransferase [Bryobacteraceae bacterium]|nr:DUF6036 family nucleotidyltransferase [Bryobacteraceae bacterium]
MQHNGPPEPWHSFFAEIDKSLAEPVALHCIGGFVVAMLYGLPRPTVDVDCVSVIPVQQTDALQSLAGKGSALHKKYGVYAQHVGIVTVPESYEERLIPMFPKAYRQLLLHGLDAHDLALSKLERNSARDREDVKYLAHAAPLDPAVLKSRYHAELRPYLANTSRHDLTIRLWLEMLA